MSVLRNLICQQKNIEWPTIDKKYLEQEEFNIVTQINGKKERFSQSVNQLMKKH